VKLPYYLKEGLIPRLLWNLAMGLLVTPRDVFPKRAFLKDPKGGLKTP